MNINDIFTDEELAGFERALEPMHPPGAYAPGRWMANPLNRAVGEKEGNLPSRVILRDITLRTLEQMPGIANARADRLTLLRAGGSRRAGDRSDLPWRRR